MDKLFIGTWNEIPSPYVVNIMARAGLNFIIADMEHGILNFETIQNMVFAAHEAGKELFVRVPSIREEYTTIALDAGADGIVFPGISRVSQVEKINELLNFSPKGSRGFNPFVYSGNYGNIDDDFFAKENKRIKKCIIIEGIEALEHLEELISSDIDIVYVGQYDLSMALGIPGQIDNELIIEKLKQISQFTQKYNKLAGCMVHTTEDAKKYVAMNYTFLVYKVDSGLLYQTCQRFVEEINK